MTDDDVQQALDRIAGFAAARPGTPVPRSASGLVASVIDHTLLRPDATAADVDRLCREAVDHAFATVCVNPRWVGHAAARVAGSGVGVCAVVGFPLGATLPDVKGYETGRVIADGASEVDVVIDIGALKSGDAPAVARDLAAVIVPARAAGVLTKVIIEAALLTDDEKVAACTIAKAAGAEYVKTSTGFGPGGATVADVALMRRVVGPDMGVKAAGGVREFETFVALIAAGATRVGASAGVRIVQAARDAERRR